MFTLLSFPLTVDTPTPGGRTPLSIQVDESISQGYPGNTYFYTAWNHAGTHIDAPAHMLPRGKPITYWPIQTFIFSHPLVLDVPKDNDSLIVPKDLEEHKAAIATCDLLLLRTGFERYRAANPIRYRDRNPGLSSEVAHYLDNGCFTSLHAVGIDTISMAAARHPHEGVEAHKISFSRRDGSVLFLIEDMKLSHTPKHLERVFVVPLLIEGLDSCPCTVIAELREENSTTADNLPQEKLNG